MQSAPLMWNSPEQFIVNRQKQSTFYLICFRHLLQGEMNSILKMALCWLWMQSRQPDQIQASGLSTSEIRWDKLHAQDSDKSLMWNSCSALTLWPFILAPLFNPEIPLRKRPSFYLEFVSHLQPESSLMTDKMVVSHLVTEKLI